MVFQVSVKKYLVMALFVGGLFSGVSARAQLTGDYRVHVNIDNTFGKDWNNLGTAIAGWICTSSSTVQYKERHKDYRGQEQDEVKQQQSNFGTTLLHNPDLQMSFRADMGATSNTKVIVNENCHFDPTVINAGVGVLEKVLKQSQGGGSRSGRHGHRGHSGGGNDVHLPRAQEDFAFMTWECNVDEKLPRVVGETLVSDCRSTNVSFPFSLQQVVANIIKDKKIRASFTLDDKKETFTKNFCGDNRRDRVIFHLGGGVGGHATEHGFVFDVEIKNETTGEKHEFAIDTYDGSHNNGTLNDDIAYCGSAGKRDRVSVTVRARTKHSIFKDRPYFGRDGSETVSFNLGDYSGDQSKDINLHRNTAWGNRTDKYDSDIEVTLIDPSAGATSRGEGQSLAMDSSATH